MVSLFWHLAFLVKRLVTAAPTRLLLTPWSPAVAVSEVTVACDWALGGQEGAVSGAPGGVNSWRHLRQICLV